MALTSSSSKTPKAGKVPLAKQSLAGLPIAMALTALIATWGVVQFRSEASFGLATLAYCLVWPSHTSGIYTEYWLWMLHCLLDRKENLESRIRPIAHMATEFQAFSADVVVRL